MAGDARRKYIDLDVMDHRELAKKINARHLVLTNGDVAIQNGQKLVYFCKLNGALINLFDMVRKFSRGAWPTRPDISSPDHSEGRNHAIIVENQDFDFFMEDKSIETGTYGHARLILSSGIYDTYSYRGRIMKVHTFLQAMLLAGCVHESIQPCRDRMAIERIMWRLRHSLDARQQYRGYASDSIQDREYRHWNKDQRSQNTKEIAAWNSRNKQRDEGSWKNTTRQFPQNLAKSRFDLGICHSPHCENDTYEQPKYFVDIESFENDDVASVSGNGFEYLPDGFNKPGQIPKDSAKSTKRARSTTLEERESGEGASLFKKSRNQQVTPR
ncbi:hypothetical protein B7463_g5344, partial [Scytalidium lignicola]